MPKYPKIKVKLTERDGNAFVVMGAVEAALRKGKVPVPEIEQYLNESQQGDYNHLLQTAMRWVTVS